MAKATKNQAKKPPVPTVADIARTYQDQEELDDGELIERLCDLINGQKLAG